MFIISHTVLSFWKRKKKVHEGLLFVTYNIDELLTGILVLDMGESIVRNISGEDIRHRTIYLLTV